MQATVISITAIIAVHNGTATLGRVLEHLSDNQVDVVLIDHGSTDDISSLISRFWCRPIVRVVQAPFDGVYNLKQLLDLKDGIAASIDAGWLIHMDADEILESPRPEETLRGFIERTDSDGYGLIDCDEFVFCPHEEDEDHAGADYVQTMRRYYYFAPANRSLHRVAKRNGKFGNWAEHAGHRLQGETLRVAPEKARMRHYIGLSLDHLRAQYLSRVFAADPLRRGWHGRRVAVKPDLIVQPEGDRLRDLDLHGWRTDQAQKRHLVFRENPKFAPPAPIGVTTEHLSMPFVVGAGRSGTTLLRLLLDAHPELAMTPETHWLRPVLRHVIEGRAPKDMLRKLMLEGRGWSDMGIMDSELDGLLEAAAPERPGEVIRGIYSLYARRFGAARVGDRTPMHGLVMHDIATILPEAQFIHIIRDGRDVAASCQGQWFGPGQDMRAMAIMWMWRIREVRQQAQFLPHYLEVRFEDLVVNPQRVLRRIGSFINLPFVPAQLDGHLRIGERLMELQDVEQKGEIIGAEHGHSAFSLIGSPADPSRIGMWKTSLSAADIEAFERVAGDMLTDLGYRRSTRKRWWPEGDLDDFASPVDGQPGKGKIG